MTDTALPSFRSPPLDEVVLGIQFQPLAGFDVRHLGQLCERFNKQFPVVELQPPLPAQIERFGQLSATPTIKFEFGQIPLLPRVWLLGEAKNDLLQIQNDRLLRNWRRVDGTGQYPRYEQVRKAFLKDLEQVKSFLSFCQLPAISVTQCEVTYVNQIPAQIRGSDLLPAEVFSVFATGNAPHFPSKPEALRYAVTRVIEATQSSSGKSILGRLHVELASGFDARTSEPLYLLNLTLRGMPESDDLSGVVGFFDMARDRIVRSFAEVTTPHMHDIWERER